MAPGTEDPPTLSASSLLSSDISSSWVKPRMEFSGVRSSWLVLDRNEFFALVALVAPSMAFVSSAARVVSNFSAG